MKRNFRGTLYEFAYGRYVELILVLRSYTVQFDLRLIIKTLDSIEFCLPIFFTPPS